MHQIGERYVFSATVVKQVSARRFYLEDVFNVTLNTSYRYHLWVTTKTNNLFCKTCEVLFYAKIDLYMKKSGKLRFGLSDFEIIQNNKL